MARRVKISSSSSSSATEQHQGRKVSMKFEGKIADVAKPRRNKNNSKKAKMKMNGDFGKRKRTKFEEYLEMEQKSRISVSAEEDLELERRLGKKLKVKGTVLGTSSDGLFELLEGTVSSLSDIQDKEDDIRAQKDDNAGGMKDRKNSKKDRKNVKNDIRGGRTESKDKRKEGVSSKSDFDENHIESGSESDDGLDGISESDGSEGISGSDGSELVLGSDDSDGLEGKFEEGSELDDDEKDEEGKYDQEGEPILDSEEDEMLKKDNNPEAKVKPLVKYVAPHLRETASVSVDIRQLQRRCRGLLNRLSEENVESIAQEIASFFQLYGRREMIDIITNEVIEAIGSGPRGNEQYAAVFAAFVAGIASLVGIDFGAKFLASLSKKFQDYCKEEDNLAVRNMALLLSYIYVFKLVSCDVIYDLLCSLSKTLMEFDVATILTILQTCGMGLRADDPISMKDFVLSVQHRHEELKTAATQSGTIFSSGKRMTFMLETIYEIKNNKRRVKQETIPHARLKKWLQKLGVEEVQLRSLTWKRLLDPEKKGQWWICGGDSECREGSHSEVVDFVHKESLEAEKLLQLAASQRMNTDIRRAIFCVVMSGEDYLDAFEKILRIKLSGKQDREIIRVIVECCMQEKVFNKYYSLLIRKVCHYDKNHKFTLQYCLWDHFKQLSAMETRRIMNLAHLLADLVANFVVSLSVLKVIEFSDMRTMTPKVILHFRIFFKVFLTKYDDEVVLSAFKRIASTPELEGLRVKLAVFLHQHLVKGLVQAADSGISDDERMMLMRRFAMVKKAMESNSSVF